jgi:hypothetical protein
MRGDRHRRDAARTQDSPRLLQSPHVVVDVLDHLAEDDRVERRVGERESGDVGLDDRSANAPRKHFAGGRRDVSADDQEAALLEQLRERSLSRPYVQHLGPRLGGQEELQEQPLTQLVARSHEVRCGPPLVRQG